MTGQLFFLDSESAPAKESFIRSLKINYTLLLVTRLPPQTEKVSGKMIFCNIINYRVSLKIVFEIGFEKIK